MKKALVTLAILLFGTTTARAQGSWADAMFKDKNKIETTCEFGTVPGGSQLYHQFKIKNIYSVPLDLSVRVGCNCVTATPSKNRLDPREQGVLDVFMDARRFTGFRSVNVYVTVSAPNYLSTATLKVSANSRSDIVLNPGQVSFGTVANGQTPTQTIDVEYAGAQDWKLTGFVENDSVMTAAYKELYRQPGQVGYRVTVTLKSDAPAGSLKRELYLKTNDPASPTLPILVEATIQAGFSVSPRTVSLGAMKVGESQTKRVVVRGSKPFKIVGIEGQGDGLSADLPQAAAKVHFITIKCQPAKPGELKRLLHFKTDAENDAALTVTVEGNISNSP
jgi:hypothetical protein